jgi:hypothetical protein
MPHHDAHRPPQGLSAGIGWEMVLPLALLILCQLILAKGREGRFIACLLSTLQPWVLD